MTSVDPEALAQTLKALASQYAYFLWPVLNALEGGQESWGGGDTVGGSPRSQGTHLDLDIIIAAIARCDSNVARPQPTLFDA